MFAEILVIDGAFERPVQINRAMILRCRPDWQYGGGTVTLIEMVDGTSYLSHQTPEDILGKELQ
jgi:hypothetical protein